MILGQEHWLGLDNIYDLSHKKTYQLRITMRNYNKKTKYAIYDNFYLVNKVCCSHSPPAVDCALARVCQF